MPEILRQTPKYENPCVSCAKSMANYAGIELTPDQISDYVNMRVLSEPNPLSDQKLLFLLLQPEQQSAFRQRYEHIDFTYEQ